MRIISEKTIRDFAAKFADAREPLEQWINTVRRENWPTWTDVRRTFPKADMVAVPKRKLSFVVFNIKGNHYRLITVIHFKPRLGGRVYIRGFLTHAEYSKDSWKDTL